MKELSVSSDSMRRIWHISEDIQNSMSETTHWRSPSRPLAWRPPTDVYETEDALIIRVEVAGMREADFTVSLVDRALTISGIRQDTAERRAFHQMEIPFGEFSTEIDLPYAIIPNEVEAIYRDGFLRITLPIAQPKHIKVEGQ